MTAGKFGRKPPKSPEEAPRLLLKNYLTGTLPPAPALVDYASKVDSWPIYLNDRYGDCVEAGMGHSVELTTCYGQNHTVKPTDSDIIKAYTDITGFNPNDPSTDKGTNIQEALNYWRKTGLASHKIAAFAQVDIKNLDEVDAALYLFGTIVLGIYVPQSAMDQFNHGKPWDVSTTGTKIEGGHCITLVKESTNTDFYVVTWGKVQRMTLAFWKKYCEEAWVAISHEWIDKNGHAPQGLDTKALNADYTALTGQPGPFPASPAHATPDAADAALIKVLDPWSKVKRTGDNTTAEKAYLDWKTAKNYA